MRRGDRGACWLPPLQGGKSKNPQSLGAHHAGGLGALKSDGLGGSRRLNELAEELKISGDRHHPAAILEFTETIQEGGRIAGEQDRVEFYPERLDAAGFCNNIMET